MGPPESSSVSGSARVRSGLILVHEPPSSSDRQRCCDPTYSAWGGFGANGDRVGPVPPLGHVARGLAHDDPGPRLDVGGQAGRAVVSGERVGCARVEDVGVGRVLDDVAHLAAAHRVHPFGARPARIAELSRFG